MVLLTQPSQRSSSTDALDADVIIVGAGIVGATLACSLLDSGLRVALVEARPQSAGLSNRRAYAVTLLSADIFRGLGLWDAIRPAITACSRIRLSDGAYPKVVWLDSKDLKRQDEVVYVAEHNALLKPLYDRLEQSDSLHWCCPAQVMSVDYLPTCAEVTVEIEGERQLLRSRLVVAADGAQSPLRQAADVTTKGWGYWQSCIGFTVRHEQPHQNIAYERFWPSGPFAILPLPGNRSQVVWTAPHAEAKAIAAMPEPEFIKLLEKNYGKQMGRVEPDSPRRVFPVRLMQSDRYILPRLALVGDAAHNCHPVGGQGLNMGIRDAAALAQVLRQANQRGLDIGHVKTLKPYQRWRKLENWAILAFTDFLDRTFSNQWPPIVWLRRIGLWMLRRIGPVRMIALAIMTGQFGKKPAIAKQAAYGIAKSSK